MARTLLSDIGHLLTGASGRRKDHARSASSRDRRVRDYCARRRCTASTAGIATARPRPVMISASPTGPAMRLIVTPSARPIADQGVIHAPHRAEQPTKGAVEPDRRQHGQAVFELGGFFVDDLAHGARHEFAIGTGLGQRGRASLWHGAPAHTWHATPRCENRSRAPCVVQHLVLHLLQRAGAPELVEEIARTPADHGAVDRLDDDQVPGHAATSGSG